MAFPLTKPLGRVLLAVAVLIVIVVGWFLLQVDPIFAGTGKEVIVTVHPGDSFATIAGELHQKGVIASPFALRLDSLVFGEPTVRVGSYELRQGSSFAHVKAILGNTPNVETVDVAPGLTIKEVAFLVNGAKGVRYADRFAHDVADDVTPSPFAKGHSLEGLIGAKTYLITSSTTPEVLAREMVENFDKEASSVGLSTTTSVNGLDAYQLITAASIVQKEAYYQRYMGKVARVIFNRLARGGPLQMDSTVLYYVGQDGGTVTPAMLQINTPYNTYLYPGLTPTPICTVSKAALEGVLHAPLGPWLYFDTVTPQGKTLFASTFAQQLKNEKIAKKNGMP
ncbi:MAG: endolytic transglycosylase MltG [Acidimicrobiales bacterium]